MKVWLGLCSLLSSSSLAQTDIFHGWAKDGTWYAFETHGSNDTLELHLCQTKMALGAKIRSSWPVESSELDASKCVHFLDANKAPWQWKSKLQLPPPSHKWKGFSVSTEVQHGVDDSGFVVEDKTEKQVCPASGLREDSKIQSVWWNASGHLVAALIDGQFRHCEVTLGDTMVSEKKPPEKKPAPKHVAKSPKGKKGTKPKR
jgi:hypothetical protein